jgi:UDP-N-acetylglucosamine--N-acetylmuramyl-(pentapeptide) pyrophosphoryl-undecaprenol N-acetylglucosamine transferase
VVGTGYPVRAELVAVSHMSKAEALATFDLTTERPTLFVFGGSRGAQSINRAVLAHLTTYLADIQVIHVAGQLGWDEVAEYAAQLPAELRRYYRPYPYLHEEMGAGFAAADLIVARGGASMLGEGPLFGTPAILVPYPHAWRTQKINADYLVERGAAVRLEDEALMAELHTAVLNLLHDKVRLAEMAQSAAQLANPTAARTLAELILKMGRKS